MSGPGPDYNPGASLLAGGGGAAPPPVMMKGGGMAQDSLNNSYTSGGYRQSVLPDVDAPKVAEMKGGLRRGRGRKRERSRSRSISKSSKSLSRSRSRSRSGKGLRRMKGGMAEFRGVNFFVDVNNKGGHKTYKISKDQIQYVLQLFIENLPKLSQGDRDKINEILNLDDIQSVIDVEPEIIRSVVVQSKSAKDIINRILDVVAKYTPNIFRLVPDSELTPNEYKRSLRLDSKPISKPTRTPTKVLLDGLKDEIATRKRRQSPAAAPRPAPRPADPAPRPAPRPADPCAQYRAAFTAATNLDAKIRAINDAIGSGNEACVDWAITKGRTLCPDFMTEYDRLYPTYQLKISDGAMRMRDLANRFSLNCIPDPVAPQNPVQRPATQQIPANRARPQSLPEGPCDQFKTAFAAADAAGNINLMRDAIVAARNSGNADCITWANTTAEALCPRLRNLYERTYTTTENKRSVDATNFRGIVNSIHRGCIEEPPAVDPPVQPQIAAAAARQIPGPVLPAAAPADPCEAFQTAYNAAGDFNAKLGVLNQASANADCRQWACEKLQELYNAAGDFNAKLGVLNQASANADCRQWACEKLQELVNSADVAQLAAINGSAAKLQCPEVNICGRATSLFFLTGDAAVRRNIVQTFPECREGICGQLVMAIQNDENAINIILSSLNLLADHGCNRYLPDNFCEIVKTRHDTAYPNVEDQRSVEATNFRAAVNRLIPSDPPCIPEPEQPPPAAASAAAAAAAAAPLPPQPEPEPNCDELINSYFQDGADKDSILDQIKAAECTCKLVLTKAYNEQDISKKIDLIQLAIAIGNCDLTVGSELCGYLYSIYLNVREDATLKDKLLPIMLSISGEDKCGYCRHIVDMLSGDDIVADSNNNIELLQELVPYAGDFNCYGDGFCDELKRLYSLEGLNDANKEYIKSYGQDLNPPCFVDPCDQLKEEFNAIIQAKEDEWATTAVDLLNSDEFKECANRCTLIEGLFNSVENNNIEIFKPIFDFAIDNGCNTENLCLKLSSVYNSLEPAVKGQGEYVSVRLKFFTDYPIFETCSNTCGRLTDLYSVADDAQKESIEAIVASINDGKEEDDPAYCWLIKEQPPPQGPDLSWLPEDVEWAVLMSGLSKLNTEDGGEATCPYYIKIKEGTRSWAHPILSENPKLFEPQSDEDKSFFMTQAKDATWFLQPETQDGKQTVKYITKGDDETVKEIYRHPYLRWRYNGDEWLEKKDGKPTFSDTLEADDINAAQYKDLTYFDLTQKGGGKENLNPSDDLSKLGKPQLSDSNYEFLLTDSAGQPFLLNMITGTSRRIPTRTDDDGPPESKCSPEAENIFKANIKVMLTMIFGQDKITDELVNTVWTEVGKTQDELVLTNDAFDQPNTDELKNINVKFAEDDEDEYEELLVANKTLTIPRFILDELCSTENLFEALPLEPNNAAGARGPGSAAPGPAAPGPAAPGPAAQPCQDSKSCDCHGIKFAEYKAALSAISVAGFKPDIAGFRKFCMELKQCSDLVPLEKVNCADIKKILFKILKARVAAYKKLCDIGKGEELAISAGESGAPATPGPATPGPATPGPATTSQPVAVTGKTAIIRPPNVNTPYIFVIDGLDDYDTYAARLPYASKPERAFYLLFKVLLLNSKLNQIAFDKPGILMGVNEQVADYFYPLITQIKEGKLLGVSAYTEDGTPIIEQKGGVYEYPALENYNSEKIVIVNAPSWDKLTRMKIITLYNKWESITGTALPPAVDEKAEDLLRTIYAETYKYLEEFACYRVFNNRSGDSYLNKLPQYFDDKTSFFRKIKSFTLPGGAKDYNSIYFKVDSNPLVDSSGQAMNYAFSFAAYDGNKILIGHLPERKNIGISADAYPLINTEVVEGKCKRTAKTVNDIVDEMEKIKDDALAKRLELKDELYNASIDQLGILLDSTTEYLESDSIKTDSFTDIASKFEQILKTFNDAHTKINEEIKKKHDDYKKAPLQRLSELDKILITRLKDKSLQEDIIVAIKQNRESIGALTNILNFNITDIDGMSKDNEGNYLLKEGSINGDIFDKWITYYEYRDRLINGIESLITDAKNKIKLEFDENTRKLFGDIHKFLYGDGDGPGGPGGDGPGGDGPGGPGGDGGDGGGGDGGGGDPRAAPGPVPPRSSGGSRIIAASRRLKRRSSAGHRTRKFNRRN